MFDRDRVVRFTIEAVCLALVSVFIMVLGIFATNGNEYERVQSGYYETYNQVLEASSYQPIQSSLISGYSGINGVYEGLDAEGNPVGYVIEVEVTDHNTGYPLELLVGVDYNTASLTGLMRDPRDSGMSSVTDEQIGIIAAQTLGSQIPVAYGVDLQTEGQDISDQVRLEGLNDGIYYAQSLSADRAGYIDYVEMSIENGVITMVQWDAFNTDMNIKNRRESSLDGV